MLRSSPSGAGSASRANRALSVAIRSGAVSTSVPSRSKTMVGAAMCRDRSNGGDHEARNGPEFKAVPCVLTCGPSRACALALRRGTLVLDLARRANGASKARSTISQDPRFPPAMSSEDYKRQAAAAALEFVEPCMRLGLGTGSTAKRFVALLADRVRAGLDVVGVATSEATRTDAERLGLALTTLDETPELD